MVSACRLARFEARPQRSQSPSSSPRAHSRGSPGRFAAGRRPDERRVRFQLARAGSRVLSLLSSCATGLRPPRPTPPSLFFPPRPNCLRCEPVYCCWLSCDDAQSYNYLRRWLACLAQFALVAYCVRCRDALRRRLGIVRDTTTTVLDCGASRRRGVPSSESRAARASSALSRSTSSPSDPRSARSSSRMARRGAARGCPASRPPFFSRRQEDVTSTAAAMAFGSWRVVRECGARDDRVVVRWSSRRAP
jgi:hypothetical protein